MVNESDSTHVKLPTLDEAQTMDFAALSRALRQVLDGRAWDEAVVNKENQFRALLEHLRSRLPEVASIPPIEEFKPPAFNDAWRRMAHVIGSSFAQRLASVEKSRLEQIESAIRGVQTIKNHQKFASKARSITFAIQEVRSKLTRKPLRGLGASETVMYGQWVALFIKSLEEYADQKIRFLRASPAMLLQAHEIESRTNESLIDRTRRKVVESLIRDFDQRHERIPEVFRVPWILLPKGADGITQLTNYVREFQRRHPDRRMCPERIDFACSLEPAEVYIGNDEFEGYLALVFSHSGKVLLEHPKHGNAAYVFNENWRELSRLSRTVLLQKYCGSFKRVLHIETGNWRDLIRNLVGRY